MPCRLARLAGLLLLTLFAVDALAQPAGAPTPPAAPTPPGTEAAPTDTTYAEATPADELPGPASGWHLDYNPDLGSWGANVIAAYALLADRTPQDTVIVAVIDSGVDIDHEDLRGVLWTNPDEQRNGTDDDGNGYVDDLHGWNFIGGPDSAHVEFDTYEVTRLYAPLRERFEGTTASGVAPEDSVDFARYLELRVAYETDAMEARQLYAQVQQIQGVVEQSMGVLKKYLGTDAVTPEDRAELAKSAMPLPADVQQAVGILAYLDDNGISAEDVLEAGKQLRSQIDYGYNLDFDPRPIVGDDYSDPNERTYGNADVYGPAADHGTHVAGIIAADRSNELGIAGVAAPVQIMVLRTVPDGDERDKDVANAIRYAVDNGARVVNMSFGKSYSPQKEVVDAAVLYAEEQGVLLVHAAGNSAEDLDVTPNFPTRRYLDGTEATNWLEVGASSWAGEALLPADFSNYGQTTVDLFAPGVAINSTMPEGTYEESDGTSMAAPVVAGAAALLLAYFPDLTAQDVRAILMDSATDYADLVVTRPDGSAMAGMGVAPQVPFGTLSVSGGLLNVAAAVEAAIALAEAR
ncbi:MAG: S8 family peptidase [Bacteroidota bacterium]